MSLDNTKLLDFLDEIEKELTRKIVLVAVGGTAMIPRLSLSSDRNDTNKV